MNADFIIVDGVLTEYEGNDAEIVIPDGVIKIGDYVFQENKTITKVIMPDTVKSVGKEAFKKCTRLKSVVFSNMLEEINNEAFIDCKALKALELPKTLRSLGYGTFEGCTKLTSIKCESEVFEAGSNPFCGYNTVPSEHLADEQGFVIFCGILYNYLGTATEISIPDGVRIINDRVFMQNSWRQDRTLKSVLIPDSVKEIRDYAFANNRQLKRVHIPAGIKLGNGVFDGCNGLADENGFFVYDGAAYSYYGKNENVKVSEGVKELLPGLFAKMKIQSIELPESLESIGSAAFIGCAFLESIRIPESVKYIGREAFKDCEKLTSISIPDTVESIGDGIFIGCKGLADENGFVAVNNEIHSFYGANREIIVPKGITAIADGAFNYSGITSIRLPASLKKLGSAFHYCECLTEIELPEGITKLEDNTFLACTGLETVSLPDTLLEIGKSVFEGCWKLKEIRIPDGVNIINNSAFKKCKSLQEICIPEGISTITNNAFSGCEKLVKIVLPNSLQAIDRSAFEDCINLKEISIPDTVEKIESAAFKNCMNLKKVNCNNSDVAISPDTFEGCTGLADKNGLTIVASLLFKCEDSVNNVVVPEGVTEIGPNVFREGWSGTGRWSHKYKDKGTLKSITLPSTLKKIHNGAFAGCNALKEVDIPYGVEVIGENCFANCEKLRTIELPDCVVQAGKQAFSGCVKLETIKLSASMTELGTNFFSGCETIKNIFIPSNIISIGKDVLTGCSALESIDVDENNPNYCSIDGILYNKAGDTLVYVPGGKKLREYTIPEHVKTIEDHAFIDCEILNKVVIPATVENIGYEVFARKGWNSNPALTDIEVSPEAGSGTVGEDVFDLAGWEYSPLVYPKLPVTFVKDQMTQICLGLGYCLNPDKYEGEYAEIYRKYALSHQRSLIKKAQDLKLTGVKQYFPSEAESEDSPSADGYKPDLSVKKPSELRKVEILEEAVQKGTLEDLKAVLKTYKTFELTARALGLAARYRGIDFVRELVNNKATFTYNCDASMQRKYTMCQNTAAGFYCTEYYLMLVPAKIDINNSEFEYTPMCGVKQMDITSELENTVLPLKDRIEVVKYFAEKKNLGVSLDEMLFWALTRSELDFADALIEMGVDLQKTPPKYYSCNTAMPYMETITEVSQSLYWNAYVSAMAKLNADQLLPVLERLHSLAAAAGKKLAMSQKMFEDLKWSDESLFFAIENMDFSKINKKKTLETVVSENAVAALEIMAGSGWISQSVRRENLIDFARANNKHEALAWLMDFKNRTVDIAAEAEKEEKKMMRSLLASPDSVQALKKIWSYKKREDGTLEITSYKGTMTEIEVPSKIGKSAVTAIGEYAFSASAWWRRTPNNDTRKKIKSVSIPEGITEIGQSAFSGCESMEAVQLPETLLRIREYTFSDCRKLTQVSIPKSVKSIAQSAF